MKIRNTKSTKGKLIKKVIIAIIIVFCIICIAAYLLIRGYIHKMHLVKTSNESKWTQTIPEDMILDEENEISNTPNSTDAEIITVEEEIRRNMEENSIPIMYNKNVFNILLIGSDTREAGGKGRSDTLIIISINKKDKTITLTSILRDIYLQISEKSNNRINAAYSYGGAELLLDTIKNNFKIDIDYYVAVDFFAFMDVIDAMGGIELEVSKEELPIINRYVENLNNLTDQPEGMHQISEPGTYLLNGKQVLSYARNRYIGKGDFDRTARQRKVLEKLFDKIKDMGILEIDNLLNIVLPKVTTNLTEGEIFSLILSLPSMKSYDIDQWSIPMNGSYSFMKIRGMDVISIDFQKNIKEINSRIYGDLLQ